MRVLALSFVFFALIARPVAVRGDGFVVDQRCEPAILWSQYSITGFTPIGQEFTPTFARLDGVELWVASQNGTGTAGVVVRVRQDTVTTVADGWDAPLHFSFATPVDLVPGARHVIEVARTVGPGNVLLAGDDTDSYSGGRPILGGATPIPGDFWFRTGADASTPTRGSSWGEIKRRYR